MNCCLGEHSKEQSTPSTPQPLPSAARLANKPEDTEVVDTGKSNTNQEKPNKSNKKKTVKIIEKSLKKKIR